MTETTLGRRIGQRRKMLGLSQESFGEKMGVSRQAISKWEADAAIPEVDRLVEMSKIFGVSVGWLLGVEEKEEAPANPFAEAFRPPELTPDPEPDPEPEPRPDPEPEPAAPPKQHRWLPWLTAAMAGVGLVLAITAVVISGSAGSPPVDADLTALQKKLAEQEQTISDLSHRIDTLASLNYEQRVSIYDLKNELQKLKSQEEQAPDVSEDLERWELIATADEALSTATVRFSCLTGADVAGATLVIRSEEEIVQSLPCTGTGGIFTAQTQLEPKNGYRYTLLLDYPDGDVRSTDVTNAAASNLLDGISIQVYGVVKKQEHYNLTPERFWVAYDSVLIKPPKLDTTGRTYQLKNLTLRYVCNGQAQVGLDLTDLLPSDVLSGENIEFNIPMQFFDMPSCKEGDTHQLILEGHAESSDLTQPIYQVLTTWTVQGQTLVLSTG